MSPTNSKVKSPETEKRDAGRPRNPLTYLLSVALLVIIIIAFVVFPISTSGIRDNTKTTFGVYNGTEIAFKPGNYFEQQYTYTKQTLQSQQSSTSSMFQEYSAMKSAFDQTVLHTALIQEANRLGISVTDSKLDKELVGMPRFQGADGKFDIKLLNKISQHDLASLRSLTKENLINDIIVGDLLSGPKVSSQEKSFMETMGTWQRSFNYLSFNADDYPDSELAVYGQKNKDLFRSIGLSQISVATKDLATDLRKQLVDGKAKFEDLVAVNSTDVYKDLKGVRGTVYFKDLKSDLPETGAADGVFKLANGSYSDVLSQGGSFVIYRADTAATDADFAKADVLKAVRDYMKANERGVIEDYLTAKGKSYATDKKNLPAIAAASNKQVKTTAAFPINIGGLSYGSVVMFPAAATSDGQAIGNAADRDAFFETAFKLQKGTVSDPVVLQDEVLLLELKEEKTVKPGDLQTYLGFDQFIQFMTQNDVRGTVVKSDKLVDNFDSVFSKIFVQQGN